MRRIIKFFFRLIIILLLLSVGSVVLYRYVPVPITPLMVRNAIGDAIEGKPIKIRHDWVPLTEMSPHMKSAVIASEDQRFYSHDGFDWKEISNAIEERRSGKRKRGGSTISQQTAKNVYTFCTSTWARKGIETYYTLLIEWIWPKERILEVYLNSIEMGPSIYGAEAVAQEHFGKLAAKLTRAECALIAATLPNPKRYSSKAPSQYMRKRQRDILNQMR
ncbi:MAG: monofunctional biosynthetic peptidoglycan transglycosylase [Bacteroidaceae bacterium]|nr:monofunctional biosynthetic peptidoglycan transglycosylase [Bacteroidaceae bacterium]